LTLKGFLKRGLSGVVKASIDANNRSDSLLARMSEARASTTKLELFHSHKSVSARASMS